MSFDVKVRSNTAEDLEFALRKLKRKIKRSNVILELRAHDYYIKKSDKRREKKNIAKNRNKARLASGEK